MSLTLERFASFLFYSSPVRAKPLLLQVLKNSTPSRAVCEFFTQLSKRLESEIPFLKPSKVALPSRTELALLQNLANGSRVKPLF